VNKGKYKVIEKVGFTHSKNDKMHILSLVDYNLRKSGMGDNKMDIISDQHDHSWTVRLLKYHIKNFLPPYWQGLRFLRKASTKIIKKSNMLGITFIFDMDSTSPIDRTPTGKVGKSFLSRQVQQPDILYTFKIAEKFTGHKVLDVGVLAG
jgi:hypothetical protein